MLQRPSRLVIDFETTRLGNVPPKIRVNEAPIQEIRLGYANSRARVVVDFGNGPVPKFKVEQGHSMLVVALDKGGRPSAPPRELTSTSEMSPPEEAFKAPVLTQASPRPRPAPAARGEVARGSVATKNVTSSPVTVKTTGVQDNVVFVELADRRNAKRTCRLVVDVDPRNFNVRNVTVSDMEGNLKVFQVAETEAHSVPTVTTRTGVGPRRMPVAEAAPPPPAKKKLQWGAPAAQPGQAQSAPLRGAPGRLESFQLRHRNAGHEG
jgi:hypothetical protein